MTVLLFDLHGNGRVWEVDTKGPSEVIEELTLDLIRNKRAKAGQFMTVEADWLLIGERLSNHKLAKLSPKAVV